MKMKSLRLLPLLGAFCLTATVARASTTIVYDSFSRTGALNGSNADTGQTWTGTNSAWNPSGGSLFINGNGGASSIGGLTLVPNCVYTLSMDVLDVNSSPTNGWVALGFYGGAGNPMNNGRGSMLVRTTNEVQTFALGTSVLENITPMSLVTSLAVELTTGPILANSTLQYKINGAYTGRVGTVDANGINSVFIQSIFDHTESQVDNFRLVHDAVPEPSAVVLGLGSGLGLLLKRRRRAAV